MHIRGEGNEACVDHFCRGFFEDQACLHTTMTMNICQTSTTLFSYLCMLSEQGQSQGNHQYSPATHAVICYTEG